jgi:hypothetical protein
MSAIEQQSAKIAAIVWGDTGMGDDPVPPPAPPPAPTPHPFLDLIMSLFKTLLPMLLTCLPLANRPQRVTRMFNRQLRGHRAQLREVIDQQCTDQDPKAAIEDAFLTVGKTIKEDDVAAMLSEVQ